MEKKSESLPVAFGMRSTRRANCLSENWKKVKGKEPTFDWVRTGLLMPALYLPDATAP